MSFQIVSTCPHCGNDKWMKHGDVYVCDKCGCIMNADNMPRTEKMPMDELIVPINGGSICAWRNHSTENPAVGLCYRTEDGTMLDIAYAEAFMENGGRDVFVYTYDDVFDEDWQRRFVLRKADIERALNM